MSMVTESKMQFDDATVHVRVTGDGPPVVLINGLGTHTAMWAVLERELSTCRVIEFDLPGAGQSEVPRRPWSMKQLARLTVAVMHECGVDRADMLGYSMGGMIAQQVAADSPDRVRRIVLAASTPGVGAVQGNIKALLNIVTPIRYLSSGAYEKTIGSLAGGRARYDKAWVAEQGKLRREHAPSWRGYFGQLASMKSWSALPMLAGIRHPVLVLAGDDDPLTPVVNAMMLSYLLPNGRLKVFPDEGHLMMLDSTSPALPAIREFLAADDLDAAPVWQTAKSVTAEELRTALAQPGFQLPPWSITNARMRRQWLGLDGSLAPTSAGDA